MGGAHRERLGPRGRRLAGGLEDRLSTCEADGECERWWRGGADPAYGVQRAPSLSPVSSTCVCERQERLASMFAGIVEGRSRVLDP